MSAKGIIILLTGCAALGGFALLRSQRTLPAPPTEPVAAAEAAVAPEPPPAVAAVTRHSVNSPIAQTTAAEPAPEMTMPAFHDSATAAPSTDAVLAEIEEHFLAGDTDSLRRIAGQLRHSQPRVRLAAREALRDANDRALLPDIQLALEATSDATEAAELRELADYLQLPSYTELKSASPDTQASRIQRQRVTAPLTATRTTTSRRTDAPTAGTSTSTAEQLARLQAENERLKQENAELRALTTSMVAQ